MMKMFKLGCLTMAGLIALLIVMRVIVGGGSSGSGSSSSTGAGSTGSAPASAKSTVFAVGDRVELGDYAYTIHQLGTATVIGNPKFGGEKAGQGATFVIVEYTIENLTNESQTVLSDDLKLLDSKGRKFDTSSRATTALLAEEGQDFLLSELQPGLPKRTKTAFLVPQDATSGELKIVIPEKGLFSGGEAVVKVK